MKSIVEIFNTNNYDQIYSMFNDRLKNEVKSDIVLKFFSDVKGFHGKIKDFEFMKFDQGMFQKGFSTNFSERFWCF